MQDMSIADKRSEAAALDDEEGTAPVPGLGAIRVMMMTLALTLGLGMIVIAVAIVTLIARGGDAGSPAGLEGDVALPPGAQIVDMATGDERLILRVRTADGERLLIYDLATGTPLGGLDVVAAPTD